MRARVWQGGLLGSSRSQVMDLIDKQNACGVASALCRIVRKEAGGGEGRVP